MRENTLTGHGQPCLVFLGCASPSVRPFTGPRDRPPNLQGKALWGAFPFRKTLPAPANRNILALRDPPSSERRRRAT